MSARLEWVNAHYATIGIIDATNTVDSDTWTTVDPGNIGLSITGENRDGVVIEGEPLDVLKLLMTASAELAEYIRERS